MTALEAYRDDGPLARWAAGKLRARARPGGHPLAWLVPPLVRLLDYGYLIGLTLVAEPDAMPFCFAFLFVLAFHHYDVVYRLRQTGETPPRWVHALAGGWEIRLLAATGLALLGVLEEVFVAASVVLGLVYAVESTVTWARFGRTSGPVVHEEEPGAGE